MLGSDFDYELISHLSQLQRFTEEQDEKQQKGNAVSVLVNNEFFSEALFYIFMLQRNEELYEKEVEITIMSHIFMNSNCQAKYLSFEIQQQAYRFGRC